MYNSCKMVIDYWLSPEQQFDLKKNNPGLHQNNFERSENVFVALLLLPWLKTLDPFYADFAAAAAWLHIFSSECFLPTFVVKRHQISDSSHLIKPQVGLPNFKSIKKC